MIRLRQVHEVDVSAIPMEALRLRLEKLYIERQQKEDALEVENRKHKEIVESISVEIELINSLIKTFDQLLHYKQEMEAQDK